MLRELHISGLGVIDDLDLALHPGLNVLTGETGAGKTMITVGLALALGARASASTVERGAGAARVQALFDPREGAEDWSDDDALLLSRSVSAEGRGTCRIGGQLATASALASLGASSSRCTASTRCSVCSSPSSNWTSSTGSRAPSTWPSSPPTGDSTASSGGWARRSTTSRAAARKRERELDLLGYQTREIEAVMPRAGESDELTAEEARLGHAERLIQAGAVAEDRCRPTR